MRATILHKLKNLPWFPICLLLLVILFFSIRLIITPDGAHYLSYVEIFKNHLPASSWDVVRGPIFPFIIFLSDRLFGETGTGILVCTFLFYLLSIFASYKLLNKICENYKHKKIITNLVLAILILNPMILGFFHVLLTEFVAITLTILNILVAYRWLNIDLKNKKQTILYALYFILNLTFCFHLKQPYIIISFVPLLTSAIITMIKNHSLKNLVYRISTILISAVFLIISIFSWDAILRAVGADFESNRDSASMLSSQLLQTYEITQDEDGNEITGPISTTHAVGLIAKEFFKNPSKITGIYFNNYCSLSSLCLIESEDDIKYVPTSKINLFDTFENSIIGYRPYSRLSNVFSIPDAAPKILSELASKYDEGQPGIIASAMKVFRLPTNILFKIATLGCFPALIFLIIIKIRRKDKKYSQLFYLNIILLITSFAHLAISAGIGLIIDRYAIEIFIPSLLGIFGTITYFYITKKSLANLPKKASK